MRIVIQRVNHASVKVDGETIGSIGKGYLLLLGVAEGDTKEMVDRYVKKLSTLRIFADEEGKTNLSITDVGGEVLVVSQFTLYADCKKGNRKVECGSFGADMKVELENDGPFTIFWDSDIW